jgi:DNA-binding response OmpR family regulator
VPERALFCIFQKMDSTSKNTTKTQINNSSAVQSQAAPPVAAPTAGANSPVILLVEDDPVLSKMYTEKFKFEGFNVLSAGNGEDGLKMALTQKVDLILLDLMLPRLSGNELLAKLREDPKGKDITVIALTNLAEQEEKDRAMQLGAKEYLIKAMQTPEEVVKKVKDYLGKSL